MVTAIANKGKVFGVFEYDCNRVSDFVAWLVRTGNGIGYAFLPHQPSSCEFAAIWTDMEESYKCDFCKLQHKFNQEVK